MSNVRKLLSELFPSEAKKQNPKALESTLNQIKSLKTQQLQQFIRQISHLVYQIYQNAKTQISVLQIIKQLLITGMYSVYLFSNVYIFPWVVSICNFNRQQSIEKRALLLYKDMTGRAASNTNGNIQTFKTFLTYAEQFLVFFGQNYKFYPYSKYKIKNIFAKELQAQEYTRSLSQFTNLDLFNMQKNLKKRGATFRDQQTDFTDFLSIKLEECVCDSQKFHDSLFLLISLVQLSESFCISIISFRLPSFLLPDKIQIACKMIDFIISTAQIEAVQTINIRCLPFILQYLLPVDFKQNSVREIPKTLLQGPILHKLIDYYYVWYEKAKILKLSTKIYEYSLGMVQYLKKPFKLSYQNQLREFVNNLQKIEQSNQAKRAFIIDQHQQQETQICKLLKDVAFCINSQKVQRKIAYSNVLDDLTITQKDSISQFSQSLLQSARRRQGGELTSNRSETSLSNKKLKNSSRSKLIRNQLQDKKQEIENVYYYKSGLPPSNQPYMNKVSIEKACPNKQRSGQLLSFSNKKFQPSQNGYSNHVSSQANVQYHPLPIVTSKNNHNNQQRPFSSSKSEISLHSSQFSQKENNQHQHRFNKPIQSIYTSKSNKNENDINQPDKSGQFLYFEKQSQLKSQKSQQKQLKKSFSKTQIQFVDSLMNINQSQSQQILQFGIDINAKVPQTISKPKFNFKSTETFDTQLILKNIQTPKSQEKFNIQPITHKKDRSPKSTVKKQTQSVNELKQSNIQTKKSQDIKFSKVKSLNSGYIFTPKTPKQVVIEQIIIQSESSGSMIKQNSGEPHLISQSISLSNQKVPSKFKEVFKQKSQKASSILSSSRSLKHLRQIPQRRVQIPDFKKLRNLQNELGKLKKQTQKFNKELEEKKIQMQRLKKEKKQITESDPYFLKKQNQIMKILLKEKEKNKPAKHNHSANKNLTKQLKESSIKNYNMSLKDYNNQIVKLKFANVKGYIKQQIKNIISNRCILLKNDLVQIGYSFKNNEVTLYLTLKYYCDSLQIDLVQNSINFSESIRRSFDKLYVGKQMKFKTQVNETKENNKFIPATVIVKLTYQHKLQQKNEEFTCQLPLTPYNMAVPLPQNEASSLLSQSKNETTTYVTPLYTLNEDFVKKGKSYMANIFPHGYFNQDGSVFTINYKWKDRIQLINIKLKQRAFRIQGTGYPMQSGRELIQTVISLLIDRF